MNLKTSSLKPLLGYKAEAALLLLSNSVYSVSLHNSNHFCPLFMWTAFKMVTVVTKFWFYFLMIWEIFAGCYARRASSRRFRRCAGSGEWSLFCFVVLNWKCHFCFVCSTIEFGTVKSEFFFFFFPFFLVLHCTGILHVLKLENQ